ncbi:MAG: flagellar biosynthesis protein FliQ [Clostridiales bacterium]|nr:flagellar biosynthesis protein FliQ [Clostridiales bacterium]MCF8021709.1 flagellar biosynthesis protein FliQ [Clostridiales bacterium]
MNETFVIDIAREALLTSIIVMLPPLGVALLSGLVVAILQAATQIQEQSLAFVPKIVAVLVTLAITAPWIIRVLTSFTTELYHKIPNMLV